MAKLLGFLAITTLTLLMMHSTSVDSISVHSGPGVLVVQLKKCREKAAGKLRYVTVGGLRYREMISNFNRSVTALPFTYRSQSLPSISTLNSACTDAIETTTFDPRGHWIKMNRNYLHAAHEICPGSIVNSANFTTHASYSKLSILVRGVRGVEVIIDNKLDVISDGRVYESVVQAGRHHLFLRTRIDHDSGCQIIDSLRDDGFQQNFQVAAWFSSILRRNSSQILDIATNTHSISSSIAQRVHCFGRK